MHPKAYFDEKPYTSDKPLPPMKKVPPSKPIPTAFKPSHPAKKVRFAIIYSTSLIILSLIGNVLKELLFGIRMYVFCFHFLFEAKRKYRCAVRTSPWPKQGCLRSSLLWLQPQGYQTNDRYLFSDDTNWSCVLFRVISRQVARLEPSTIIRHTQWTHMASITNDLYMWLIRLARLSFQIRGLNLHQSHPSSIRMLSSKLNGARNGFTICIYVHIIVALKVNTSLLYMYVVF